MWKKSKKQTEGKKICIINKKIKIKIKGESGSEDRVEDNRLNTAR